MARALRDAKVAAIVESFVDHADDSELVLLGFREVDVHAQTSLRARWPEGLSTASTLPRVYTKAGFEKAVKPNLLALDKLLGRLEEHEHLRARVDRIVGTAVERYAADYEAAVGAVYAGFQMAGTSAVGLKRVLRTLSGGGSPLGDFLDDIAHNTALGLDQEQAAVLDPLRAVEAKYAPLAKLAEPGKAGGPLVAYQDILRDAVLRLEPGPAGGPDQASLLAAALSPLGRVAFGALADPKTSPVEAARAWVQAQHLDDELGRPFLIPLEHLAQQASTESAARSRGSTATSCARSTPSSSLAIRSTRRRKRRSTRTSSTAGSTPSAGGWRARS